MSQLKDILEHHFVDYKGCLEKHELLAKVRKNAAAGANRGALFSS